jgi:protein transport protein SEC23
MAAEELQDAKDSLGQLVALLPEECLVGLVTFGATVTVHEVCAGAMPKAFVLRGTDDISQDSLKKLLGLELSAHEVRHKPGSTHTTTSSGAKP